MKTITKMKIRLVAWACACTFLYLILIVRLIELLVYRVMEMKEIYAETLQEAVLLMLILLLINPNRSEK